MVGEGINNVDEIGATFNNVDDIRAAIVKLG